MTSNHNQYPPFGEAVPHIPEADSFDFKSSLESIKASVYAHITLIVFIMMVTVGLVVTYIWVWPPVFDASVAIAADSDNDSQRNAFYQQWNIFRKQAVEDEAILMTSDPILRKVIIDLDLTYDEVYHPFMSYAIHLWGESWIGKNYRKIKYRFFPKPPLPEGLTEDMLEKFKVLKDFRRGVSLTGIGDSNVALLTVKGSTPRVAEIANKVIDVYLEERKNRYVNEARVARDTLAKETDKAFKKLLAVEKELQDFYTENSLLLKFEKDRVEMTQWLELQEELRDLETSRVRLETTLRSLNEQIEKASTDLSSTTLFHENIVNLEQKLTQLEISLDVALQKYQPGAPEVKDTEDQIKALEKVISAQKQELGSQSSKLQNTLYENLRAKIGVTESDLAGVNAAIYSKQQILKKMKPLIDKIPQKMQRTNQLQREQQILEGQYKVLGEKLVQASVSMTSAESAPQAIRIVDYASPPEKAAWPRTKLMLIAAVMLGGFLGLVSALTLDLIFVRVNAQKLKAGNKYHLFAELEQDFGFMKSLYPRRFRPQPFYSEKS